MVEGAGMLVWHQPCCWWRARCPMKRPIGEIRYVGVSWWLGDEHQERLPLWEPHTIWRCPHSPGEWCLGVLAVFPE